MAKSIHYKLRCPGCGLRCYAGRIRLDRHMRNQCVSKRVRLVASKVTH